MAVYYTNYLTGDDTTGDGSWANPYKTIYRGTQSISANGDEVRAVGSGWTDLPGTLTFTYNLPVINTSEDLTAFFPELSSGTSNNKVIITVDDEFGFYKSVLSVVAVTPTQLVMAVPWAGTQGDLDVKRLTTQHYYSNTVPFSPLGASQIYEAIDVTKISTYENLKITGGWTAEGIRDGITAFVCAFTPATGNAGYPLNQSFSPAGGAQNLYISGFAMVNHGGFNLASNSRHAIGDMWFIRCGGTFNAGSTDIVNLSGEIANMYSYDSRLNFTWQCGDPNNNQLTFNLWQTYATISNGDHGPLVGGTFTGGGTYNPSKVFNKLYFRRTYNDNYMGYGNVAWFELGGSFNAAPLLIEELYVYANNPTKDHVQFPIMRTTNGYPSVWIKKLYGFGPVGFTIAPVGAASFATLGDGTQTLNDLRLCSTGGQNVNLDSVTRNFRVLASDGTFRAYGPVASGGQGDNIVMVVREETVEKVTGTNSLAVYGSRKHPGRTSSINVETIAPIAYIPAFTATKTLTIKMKSSGVNPAQWSKFRLALDSGLGVTTMWNGNITGLSTEWQDFVYTIDTTAYTIPETMTNFPLGIEQINLPDEQTGEILYIDSITLV